MNYQEFLSLYQKEPIDIFEHNVPSQPLVSICVPTYNHVGFIKECLDGILMQRTDFDFEILLGEDASTDGTRAICIEYAQKHPDKIRLFLHKRANNIKIGGAPTGRFNLLHSLMNVQGKYINVCEGDDYWTDPFKLQKQVNFLEQNPDYKLTAHQVKIVDENSQEVDKNQTVYNGKYTSEDLAKGNFLHTASVLFLNQFTQKVIPDYMIEVATLDWVMHLSNAQKGAIHYFSEKMGAYRVHSGGVWIGKNSETRLELYKNVIKHLTKEYAPKYQKEFKTALEFMELCHTSGALGAGDFRWSMLKDLPGFFKYKDKFKYSWKDILWLYKNGLTQRSKNISE